MNRKIRSLYKLLAAIAALFILIQMITGTALNHATDFRLSKHYVKWDWLMTYYHIGQQRPDAVYLIDDKVISQFGDQVFVDAEPVFKVNKRVLGGITLDDVVVLTTDDALILLNRNGKYLKTLQVRDGIPTQIQNIGLFHGDPVLQTRSGMLRSNHTLKKWEPISLQGVTWSVAYALPDSIKTKLQQYFYGNGISLQKLLSDIHDGHFLGAYGPWIMDTLVLVLLVSLFSGWLGRRRLH